MRSIESVYYLKEKIILAISCRKNFMIIQDTSREEDGNGAKVEDSENNIISIELKPVDITKKYKIALPILKGRVIEDKYSIKILLK